MKKKDEYILKIPLKCLKFLDKLNEKYNGNVYLANEELKYLQQKYKEDNLIKLVELIEYEEKI